MAATTTTTVPTSYKENRAAADVAFDQYHPSNIDVLYCVENPVVELIIEYMDKKTLLAISETSTVWFRMTRSAIERKVKLKLRSSWWPFPGFLRSYRQVEVCGSVVCWSWVWRSSQLYTLHPCSSCNSKH
jgi:hypothetical protein